MGKLTGSSSQTVANANNAGKIVDRENTSSSSSVLSSSMITAVFNAAETARLVLDQAANENTADDNRSVSSNSTRSRSNSKRGSGGGSLMFDEDSESPQGDGMLHDEPQVEVYKNSSLDSGTPFSPPPNAFQNFPISRGFTPFHKSTVDVTDVLAGGAEFHVTNHFDAAAAISAALASSHLADAAGSVGILQMSHAKPIPRRMSVNDSSLPHEAFSRRFGRRPSAADYILETTAADGGQDTPVRSRSSGLPTPEEAEAMRLLNRVSFISVEDDVSFSNYGDSKFVLKALADEQQALSTGNVENENERKGPIEPQVKSSPEISGDNRSASFENESTTSSRSVDGSNSNSGYSSDVSPISTSTGEDSGNKNGGNTTNKTGMLGNFGKSRRASLEVSYEGRYDVEDDEYSSNSENCDLRGKQPPEGRNSNEDAKNPKVTQSKQSLVGDKSATNDDAIAPSASSFEDKQFHLKNQQSVGHPVHAPVHRVSLFNSFDRNWEEAVQGSDNSEEVLDLGRKCFAAFACMFSSCKHASGRSIFGETNFRWWVDDDALTTFGDIIAKEEEDHPAIPIAVIRSLWKTCLYDVEGYSDSEDDAKCILDSIQHTLVNDLCFLTAIETPSTTCLQLSCDVYAEYGCYILHRFSLQHQLAFWHSRFALELRQFLLDSSFTDADYESMIKGRYAAYSLPRHTAIGSLVVDSQGHFEIDTTEDKCTDLRRNLFDNLLCDEDFIKARAKVLGIGNNRPAEPDETLNSDGTNIQIMKIIEQTRVKDWNLLFSTSCQTKDIEWCASFCIPDYKEATPQQNKNDNVSTFALSACLDAIVRWAEALMASYHLLHEDGKLTICADAKEIHERELSKNGHLAQLMSHYEDKRDDKLFGTEEVAKSLLAKADSWTTKDNSSWIFKDNLLEEPSSIKSPPKGRRRKIIGNPQEERNDTSPLAQILKIDISDLRTSISLGSSLLGLAQFSQIISKKDIFDDKVKESRSLLSRLQAIQCSCLLNAIEVLSCSATALGYILSLDMLDEDDLDETVNTALGPNVLLQLFAAKREESRPLLSVVGILSADAWFSFGKLVDETCKVGNDDHLMLLCFERALLILNTQKSNASNSRAVEFSSHLSPLTKYKCFLQSNATHAIGVYCYEQGDFHHAGEHFDKASRFRRQMLEDQSRSCENDDRGNVSKLQRNYLVSSVSISEEVVANVFKHSLTHALALLPKCAFDVNELELNLSLTLEYCALNQHARQEYQNALSLFQECLILRSMHVGRNSLDVASLHFNIGVVYDDLENYDSAISRYHESLRIRLDQRIKATSPVVMAGLEDSVLLT